MVSPAFAALAGLLAIAAAAYVFAPLFRQRRAVGIAAMAVTLAVVGGGYAAIGTPQALDAQARTAPRTLTDAVARLEAEMRRDPEQAEGWRLLGDAYSEQGRSQDAANAYGRAVRLQTGDADLYAQAAEARARARADRLFDAQATSWLQMALQVDPAHQRARWFLGIALRQAGKPAEAAATWEALLTRVDGATAAALRPQIDAARADAGLSALDAPTAAPPVTVEVDIDPTLRTRAAAGAAVFVIAREAGGPPMPVAVRRIAVSELPARVQLVDADGPMPTRRLSQVPRVEVIARLSQAGVANAASGDFESAIVAVGADRTVSTVIDRVRP